MQYGTKQGRDMTLQVYSNGNENKTRHRGAGTNGMLAHGMLRVLKGKIIITVIVKIVNFIIIIFILLLLLLLHLEGKKYRLKTVIIFTCINNNNNNII